MKDTMGKRVRRLRESMSLTRDQFAEKVGITPQFLAQIENGTKGMSADTVYKISAVTNTSSDYILFGKQIINGADTPAARLLCQIPARYAEVAEEALKNILRTIEIADTIEVEKE